METNCNTQNQKIPNTQHPKSSIDWFCSETGINYSKHPSVPLPTDPFLDVVSFIFSRKHKGVSALVDSSSGYSISYSEFYPLVKSMASGLQKLGISQGDVVLVLLPNSIYFPIIFLGVLFIGAIATTMNPLSTVSEIKKQTLDSQVRFAFTESEKVPKLETLGIRTIRVPEIINPVSKMKDFHDFYQLLSCDSYLTPRPVINQDDTAAILYSSGTTGVSKGVVITHRNFIAMVELFVRFEATLSKDLSWDNVYLAVLPMFHVYGLSLFVMGLLSLGTALIVMGKFDVDEVVRAIERYSVTHFPLVPPVLPAMTMKAKGAGGNSLKSLKQVSCGAAPTSKKMIEEFVQTLPHVDFIQGYGMTESTAVGARGFNTQKFKKYTSVGLLAPNMQAKVVDLATGSFMPPGSSGELWLRGHGIMKGYLNNVEATASTVDKEGWLRTGDIAYFDQDGYLFIVDRLKEIIKYKGFQIAPADLEAVLISHPDIEDVAVTAAKEEEVGEVPVAFVVRKQESMLSSADVINYVAQQVAPYKKVRKVVFTNSIPKSAAGKILRNKLRENLSSRI